MSYPSQANITNVRIREGDADVLVLWDSTEPPGTTYQVYLDRRLVWHGTTRRTHVARPGHKRTAHIDILAVDPTDARVNRADALAAVPGGGARVRLWWYGGSYLGDVVSYNIYAGTTPGGSVSFTTPVASRAAYVKDVVDDGFGSGPFGAGGFGQAATTYVWVSDPLPAGAWNFVVKSVDSAGNEGPAKAFTATIAGPPQAPPQNASGDRVSGSYNATSRILTLTWLPSQR